VEFLTSNPTFEFGPDEYRVDILWKIKGPSKR